MHTYISIIYICIFTCMQWKGNMFVFLGVPKYVIAFPFFGIYQVKRGRPPKCKLFRKKLSGLDKITVNQLVSHEKEKAQCHKRKRATYNGLYKNAELKSAVMKQALEVQANLSSEFPSLVKCMHPSNVTGGFWVGLPKHFCSKQLPKENRTMVLEDEEGKEFQTKYLVEKVGLSGGWRGFSIAHKLLEGDVCVFHLVKPSKFKVYIVRRKGSDEVDVALGLLKLESSTQQIELEKEPKIFVKTRDKPLENYGMYENRISVEKTGKFLEVLPLDISEKAIQNDRLDLGSEVLDSIKLSESMIDFKEVKNFEDFNILVNGLIIDSEFSKYLKTKYYELCCNQKSFLHENLLEGLNCKLVAGVIAETINIADAIRAAKLTTSHHSFLTWGQTLKSFKGLGMKVGFLSARLDQLMNLSMKSRRYQEARLEQINANEKKRKLEAKLVEVTEALNRLVVDIGSLEEENADRLEILFQEVASAPR
ncbi:B3 domain-containing protein Os01g0234100-like isoform X1 [Durio zibethinus]|uniref:B3 domain-containing protein Os01g0234100-like isoform X1 n=2 Tax=Durio zibethinus TaxID=66656 RepID=A0A6P5Z175_DURZI|nr:B3 domain-containing protein Os01g0234100-like isoform X1 [Durio zibethinus]